MAVLRPEHAPPTLTTLDDRAELLAAAGVDGVLALPFARDIAAWSPQEFVERVLVGALHAAAVVVGANFRFGNRAAGDVALLREAGAERRLHGRGRRARRRPAGLVVDLRPHLPGRRRRRRRGGGTGPPLRGARRGRRGRPARPRARLPDRQRADRRQAPRPPPTASTPAGCARRDTGERCPAAISVGTNPTFDGERERRVEAYALDRDDLELYGVEVEVAFVERLRGMVTFDDVERAAGDDGRRRTPSPRVCWTPMPRRRAVASSEPSSRWFSATACPTSSPTERERAAAGAAAAQGRAARWRWSLLAGGAPPPARSPGSRPDVRRAGDAQPWSLVLAAPFYALTALRARPIVALGAATDVPAACGQLLPAGHPRAAAAAALHHVPLHQRRGVAGRRRPSTGAVLWLTMLLFGGDRRRLPAGAAARGGRPDRRRHRRRPGRARHDGTPLEEPVRRSWTARATSGAPVRRCPGLRALEPGAGAAGHPGRAGAAAGRWRSSVLHVVRRASR